MELEIIGAVLGLAAAGASLASQVFAQLRRIRELKDALLTQQLETPDLAALGQYLDETLGSIHVGIYAVNESTRQKVDHALARLSKFLGPTGVAASEQSSSTINPKNPVAKGDIQNAADSVMPASAVAGLPEEVRTRLLGGDDWAALVMMRSLLDNAARSALTASGVQFHKQAPWGLLQAGLVGRNLISPHEADELDAIHNMMNRAAHGEELSPSDRSLAIELANRYVRKFTETKS